MTPSRLPFAAPAMLAALAIACPPPAAHAAHPAPTWQSLITNADRVRLRLWRNSWIEGLEGARAAGHGADLAAAAPLFDPDAALSPVSLADGDYRCRTYKLGGAVPVVAGFLAIAAQPCHVAADRLVVTGGMQRPAGRLWPLDDGRLIFLGAMALGDESRALDYGRDALRDTIGVVERIGERRWRLVLPHPRWQSRIDIIEIVPA